MDEFNGGLKASDIVRIIKAVADTGITEFRYGSLEFSFGANDNKTEQVAGWAHEPNKEVILPKSGVDELGMEASDEISPELEAEIQQMRLEELLIADPLAHEELTQRVFNGEGID